MKKIIAFIDGSIYSKSVCEHASWLAVRSGAALDILHVLGRRNVSTAPIDMSGNIGVGARTTLLEELAELDGQKARLAHKRGRAILEDAKALASASGVDDVTTILRNDGIIETLSEFERDADLIVIGKRGEAADFDKMHLGSHLERVVRSSHKPVLVVSRSFRSLDRMLIAFDGGTSAMKAIEYIASSANLNTMDCHLLNVGEDTVKSKKQIEGAAALLRDSGYSVTAEIQPGQPEAIIASKIEQENIDLLVMGAYGHSRIRSLIIGSITTEMVRSCKVPVMLFR